MDKQQQQRIDNAIRVLDTELSALTMLAGGNITCTKEQMLVALAEIAQCINFAKQWGTITTISHSQN